MDKQEWKSFFRFIDGGSVAELQQRKDALAGVLQKVTDPGVRSDIRRMLRLIDEEVLIRCLLYTSPSPRDRTRSRMPSSA